MPTKIEWCDETLNPFWGCTHGCAYCQARKIAHIRAERLGKIRKYPVEIIIRMKRFEPVWLPDANSILAKIHKWKKPKTIFIGFMGDIACQRYEDIRYMFDVARVHLEHKFLFLSKDTARFWWQRTPQNVWIGGSVTSAQDKHNGFNTGGHPIDRNAFISFEPLIDDVQNGHSDFYVEGIIPLHVNVKWIIIGALTDRRGQPITAEKGGTRAEWVWPIIDLADKYCIPIFLKNNLLRLYPQLPIRQEFPW